MKLHEYQAKEMFSRYGIPVPLGIAAANREEAIEASRNLDGPWVVKAQVHAGGRGKAGGIKVVSTHDEVGDATEALLGSRLVTHQTGPEGAPVHKVLVEEATDVSQELYVALMIDREVRGPVVIASASGGMDIEEVAATAPERILKEGIDPVLGLQPFQGRRLAYGLGLPQELVRPASQIMLSLYDIFVENDCSLLEINPLAIDAGGKLVALDAKVDLEDDATFRHHDLLSLRDREQEDELEAQALENNIAYVKLDGFVGCLVNGAGLAMATMDVIQNAGAKPANFLDVGGGASEDKVALAVSIMLSDPEVTQVLVNVFGGILRCDIAAGGIVKAWRDSNSQLPMLVRMRGTNVDEGKDILRASGLDVTFADTLIEVSEALQASLR